MECGLNFSSLLIPMCGDPGKARGRMAWSEEIKGPHRAFPCRGRRKVIGLLLVSQERGPLHPGVGRRHERRRGGIGFPNQDTAPIIRIAVHDCISRSEWQGWDLQAALSESKG